MNPAGALVELLTELKRRDYRFIAVTPSTHARVLSRPLPRAPTLRDIFGWTRPFLPEELEPDLLKLLQQSGSVVEKSGRLSSLVRVSSLNGDLFLHSAFPTDAADAVFFGPDTYRFAAFVTSQIPTLARRPSWIVDFGAGTGAGAIVAARLLRRARLSLLDINPQAIRFANANCEAAGVPAEFAISGCLPRECDLVIANPPYMMDGAHRTYRDGGGTFGGEIAARWARQSLDALSTQGTLLLYTGAAVLNGHIPLLERIQTIAAEMKADLETYEIDPDVFGEELATSAYTDVERIAVLGIKMVKAR